MANIVFFSIWRNHHQQAPVSINMIHTILGIILSNNYSHILPVRSVRKEFDNPANSKVIIRHIAFAEGKPCFGTFAGAMIVGKDYSYQLWHSVFACSPFFIELFFKHINPELVRDSHIVCWIYPRRSVEQGSR